MSLRIRSFTPEEYPVLCAIANAIEPEYPTSEEELRYDDEHRDPKCRFQRWMAEWDGVTVAFGDYVQSAGMYHPQKFSVGVSVHPEFQGRGIGSTLYRHVMEALEPFDPILLRAGVREDRARAVRFLQDRGYREVMREWESRLDSAAFDPTPFAGVEEGVRARGVEIRILRELESDPGRDRKLYELDFLLEQDVPATDVKTQPEFEPWVRRSLEHPCALPDAWFVAVHNGAYVGYSNLWASQAGEMLYTGLTGVRREYRRQGIALALKLRAVRYAQEQGGREVRTWNEVRNEGMLAINQRLGFVRQPAWIEFEKVVER